MSRLFDDVGGEAGLRRIIDRFVDKIFDDPMIGFFFRSVRKERIKEKEYEFAARHLGADVAYTGRPLRDAHAAHPIMGGQFNRRLQILKDTFEELDVPEHVRAHWIDNTEKLRSQVTRNAGNLCDPTLAGPGDAKPGGGDR
ncbi:MAG TPA: group 1 truncated hemoglobin [Polyangiaceae bacterium]|jgi:hemoglobin|nr:group 1 truncated hemoglobin [Polyangiaceae bacterium]